MIVRFNLLIALFPLLAVAMSGGALAALKPTALRCEYKVDPLGIGQVHPRFDWKLISDQPDAKNLKQTAYQILVASSESNLKADRGDLWDSGQVKSDQTAQIVYAGKELASEQLAFWKARVWDQANQPSEWSAPARFSMGLLQPTDWKAQWIGYDVKTPEVMEAEKLTSDETLTFEGLSWIWSGAPSSGTRYFKTTVTLPPGPATRGRGVVVADSEFELYVNGTKVGSGNDWHKPQSIDYINELKPGDNELMLVVKHTGSGTGAALGRFRFKIGPQPSIITDLDSSWQVSSDRQSWEPAKPVAKYGDGPWGRVPVRALVLPPAKYLRKQFTIGKSIARATVYATALGMYELHINGQRVGQDQLTPGETDYSKRVHYQTYDVTPMLKAGDNAIGAILGDGWYSSYWHADGKRDLWGDKPRLTAKLNIEYADGTKASVVTDETWKASHGPLVEADMLMGCTYDANKELGAWDAAGYDDSKWQPPAVGGGEPVLFGSGFLAKTFEPSPGPPVRTMLELPAKAVSELSPGTYIFDLGQNMVGWTRLKLASTRPGQRITIRQAEMRNPDGTLYTVALRSARATDAYISKGGPVLWEPKFTFHGFRYVEVSGLDEQPPLDAITGVVVHSDMQQTGNFECSNPLVTQLVKNIIWSQRGNYLEIPTDCPQRDERLGWTGDAQFFIPTGAYNFDIASFFSKWLDDLIEDSQDPDGAFTSVAPDVYRDQTRDGATAWADAGIICPYTIYKVYGDTRIIARHYAGMARYIDFLQKSSKDNIRDQGPYGDWVNQGGGAKSEVIGTAYYEHVVRLMAEMAAAVGKTEDAQRYSKLADTIRQTFIREFVTPDGKIKESSQTGYCLAFAFDLLPPELRQKAADNFVEEIKNKNWHLATGFIGTPILLPALSKAGRDDVAYRLLLTDTFPGWLYQVKLGSTTMWERWDGFTPEKGFFNPGMNSFNHYAFGSVGQWLYQTVGGIDTAGPGFNKIIIRPRPGGDVTWAKTSYDSIHGMISSEWRIENGKLTLNVTIPPNTTATVELPAKDGSAKPTEIGSGHYTFTGSW